MIPNPFHAVQPVPGEPDLLVMRGAVALTFSRSQMKSSPAADMDPAITETAAPQTTVTATTTAATTSILTPSLVSHVRSSPASSRLTALAAT